LVGWWVGGLVGRRCRRDLSFVLTTAVLTAVLQGGYSYFRVVG